MSNEVTTCQMSAEFLKDYLEALTLIEYRLRNTEDSVKIINGLLLFCKLLHMPSKITKKVV